MKITTRSIAQEQHAEVAAEVVQEVLQDDLYQDPIQVGYHVTILDLCCSVVECFVFLFVFHFFPYLYGCSVLFQFASDAHVVVSRFARDRCVL